MSSSDEEDDQGDSELRVTRLQRAVEVLQAVIKRTREDLDAKNVDLQLANTRNGQLVKDLKRARDELELKQAQNEKLTQKMDIMNKSGLFEDCTENSGIGGVETQTPGYGNSLAHVSAFAMCESSPVSEKQDKEAAEAQSMTVEFQFRSNGHCPRTMACQTDLPHPQRPSSSSSSASSSSFLPQQPSMGAGVLHPPKLQAESIPEIAVTLLAASSAWSAQNPNSLSSFSSSSSSSSLSVQATGSAELPPSKALSNPNSISGKEQKKEKPALNQGPNATVPNNTKAIENAQKQTWFVPEIKGDKSYKLLAVDFNEYQRVVGFSVAENVTRSRKEFFGGWMAVDPAFDHDNNIFGHVKKRLGIVNNQLLYNKDPKTVAKNVCPLAHPFVIGKDSKTQTPINSGQYQLNDSF
mmetsp:Transcript_30335/g.61785  ORF Transcript_30335/g.61785 Transcript_30335/m.61785 type:complete len:409 (-) Transcript_30335:96-1322(-)